MVATPNNQKLVLDILMGLGGGCACGGISGLDGQGNGGYIEQSVDYVFNDNATPQSST